MNDFISFIIGMMILLGIILLIRWACLPITKAEIIEAFDVNSKTFLKWLNKFMPDLACKWKKHRTFSIVEYQLIIGKLGNPYLLSKMSKAQIFAEIEKDEAFTDTNRYRVLKNLLFGAALPAQLQGLYYFPPKMAQWLLRLAKGECEIQSFSTL